MRELISELKNLLEPFKEETWINIVPEQAWSDVYTMDCEKLPGREIYFSCTYTCSVKERHDDLGVYDIHIHSLAIAYPGMDELVDVDRVESDIYNSITYMIEDDYLENRFKPCHLPQGDVYEADDYL